MSSVDALQVFVRNEQGKVLGPFPLQSLALLIDSGHLKGPVQVSRDGQHFAPPGEFPDIRDIFPPEMWGGAPAAPPGNVPMAGPGAMAAAAPPRQPGRHIAPVGKPVVSPPPEAVHPEPVEGKRVGPPVLSPAAPPPEPESVIPAAGDFSQLSPIHLYYLAASTDATGLLTLSLSDRRVEVHFRKGNPEYVGSYHPEDSLEAFLLAQRMATEEQIAQAEAARAQFGGELVAALFGLGILNPGAAFSSLVQRATGILLRSLLSEHGQFTFERKDLPAHKAMPLGNRWSLLSELVRRMPAVELKRRLGPALDLPIMKSGGRVSPTELRFTPQETRALGFIDGVRSLNQLMRDFPQDADHFLRVAYLLRELEAVSFAAVPVRPEPAAPPPPPPPPAPSAAPKPPVVAAAPPPPAAKPAPRPAAPKPAAPAPSPAPVVAPAPAAPPKPVEVELKELQELTAKMREQNHFEVLALTDKADAGQVKVAYFRLAKLYHPDTLPPGAPAELARLKAEVFARIGEAYRTLSDDQSRANYIEALKAGGTADVDVAQILAAEDMFQKACALVKNRKYAEAVKLLEDAIKANPEEGEFYAWKGYARFFSFNDKKQGFDEAMKDINVCLKKNERCAPAHYFIGTMARMLGNNPQAIKHFNKCLELQPHHIEAQRELRLIHGKK